MRFLRKLKCRLVGHDPEDLKMVFVEETPIGDVRHYECKHGCGHTWSRPYIDYNKYAERMRAAGYR